MTIEEQLPQGFNFFVDDMSKEHGDDTFLVSICYGDYAPYVRSLCTKEDIEKTKEKLLIAFNEMENK